MELKELENIRTQLEGELKWRLDEIHFLHNQQNHISNEKDQNCYRKALVVMLYSHFEGFCG